MTAPVCCSVECKKLSVGKSREAIGLIHGKRALS